jgi:hypothetical protein
VTAVAKCDVNVSLLTVKNSPKQRTKANIQKKYLLYILKSFIYKSRNKNRREFMAALTPQEAINACNNAITSANNVKDTAQPAELSGHLITFSNNLKTIDNPEAKKVAEILKNEVDAAMNLKRPLLQKRALTRLVDTTHRTWTKEKDRITKGAPQKGAKLTDTQQKAAKALTTFFAKDQTKVREKVEGFKELGSIQKLLEQAAATKSNVPEILPGPESSADAPKAPPMDFVPPQEATPETPAPLEEAPAKAPVAQEQPATETPAEEISAPPEAPEAPVNLPETAATGLASMGKIVHKAVPKGRFSITEGDLQKAMPKRKTLQEIEAAQTKRKEEIKKRSELALHEQIKSHPGLRPRSTTPPSVSKEEPNRPKSAPPKKPPEAPKK